MQATSWQPLLIFSERDRDAGDSSTRIAFPVVADFDALDELRRHGRDHPVAAAWAARRFTEDANGGKIRWVAMRLHDPTFCFQC